MEHMAENQISLQIKVYSDAGSVREQNQDNFFVNGMRNQDSREEVELETSISFREGVEVFALFDGMGGETAGEKASLTASECMGYIQDHLKKGMQANSIGKMMDGYYGEFLQKLNGLTGSSAWDVGVCGTTGVFIILDGSRMIPVWVGDSRAYLLRDGQLTALTKDHSVAQEQISYGLMTEEQGRKSRAWHILTRYMGENEPEFSVGDSVELLDGDRLFLCSDGITDVCLDEELQSTLMESPEEIVERMKKISRTRSDDNCTIVLADVTLELVMEEDIQEPVDVTEEAKNANKLMGKSDNNPAEKNIAGDNHNDGKEELRKGEEVT